MTQYSRPWAGTTIGDAGPYTAPHWWDVWQAFMKSSGAKVGTGNLGIFYVIPGRLAVTSPAINTISVAVGAALVDGLYYESTAAETFTVPNATAGQVRDDRIVVRKTFSGATQTCRLVLLTGSEAPSPGPGTPPVLTQDTIRSTFWDLPLYRVSVTDAGVITLTDEREYVDVAQKSEYFPFEYGYSITGAVELSRDANYFMAMPDMETSEAYCSFRVPEDYVSNLQLHIVVSKVAIGNDLDGYATIKIYDVLGVSSTASSTVLNTVFSLPADDTVFIQFDIGAVWTGTVLPNMVGYIIFGRSGADASDTLGVDLKVIGVLITYNGYN